MKTAKNTPAVGFDEKFSLAVDKKGRTDPLSDSAGFHGTPHALRMDVAKTIHHLGENDKRFADVRTKLRDGGTLECCFHVPEGSYDGLPDLLESNIVAAVRRGSAVFESGGLRVRFFWHPEENVWQDRLMEESSDEEEPSITAEANKVAANTDDPGSRAAALRAKTIKPMTEADLDDLRRMIVDAQDSPPDDREQFVEDVNLLLHVSKQVIRLEDGTHAGLRVCPGKTRRGFIQFQTKAGRRSTRGFLNTGFEIVPASSMPAGRQSKPIVS